MAKPNLSFSAIVRRVFKPGLKRQELIVRLISWFVCTVMAVVIMMPVGWMLSTALKTRFEAISFPPKWLPADPQWQNFVEALNFGPWGHYFLNTLFYAGMVMLGEVLSSSFIAYAFAHLRAPGKNVLFVFVLGTVMLSMWVIIVPQYIMFSKIGWLDSYLPLILPHWFGSPYLIFILRQFYRTVPRDYVEAAVIDGANHFGIWWRIMLPLSVPALGAVAVGSFLYFYQDFVGPLIYLNDNKKFTVSLGLVQFEGAFGDVPWNLWMAASFATLVPPTLLFFIAQRYFIQGIVISGVKG